MVYSVPKSSKSVFNEVAIADFGPFQIAVPTKTVLINQRIFSTQVPIPQRHYQSQGWLIYNGRFVTAIEALTVGSIFSQDSSFKPIQRIAPATPISFEVKSAQPLPKQLTNQATFAFELPDADFPFFNVFRHVQPQFVKVYPFRDITHLSTQVKQFLAEKALFIEYNQHQLKKVLFYKTRFGL